MGSWPSVSVAVWERDLVYQCHGSYGTRIDPCQTLSLNYRFLGLTTHDALKRACSRCEGKDSKCELDSVQLCISEARSLS